MKVDRPKVDLPKVGVVDIGTNSIRLLVTDGFEEDGRWVEVTGLGVGVDASGRLSDAAISRTVGVLEHFGLIMNDLGVERRLAIATSASRDSANSDEFFDQAERALGIRPNVISGVHEAQYAFAGATKDLADTSRLVVTDIGGGSTEFVTAERAKSVDMGSVRLTERWMPDRPSNSGQLGLAIEALEDDFAGIEHGEISTHIGVAGTWTSIAAIAQNLSSYGRERVHGLVLTNDDLDRVAEQLRPLSIEKTAAIPSLDPKRAPVILAGTIIATMIVETLGVHETTISEQDSLDGAAMELLALL